MSYEFFKKCPELGVFYPILSVIRRSKRVRHRLGILRRLTTTADLSFTLLDYLRARLVHFAKNGANLNDLRSVSFFNLALRQLLDLVPHLESTCTVEISSKRLDLVLKLECPYESRHFCKIELFEHPTFKNVLKRHLRNLNTLFSWLIAILGCWKCRDQTNSTDFIERTIFKSCIQILIVCIDNLSPVSTASIDYSVKSLEHVDNTGQV